MGVTQVDTSEWLAREGMSRLLEAIGGLSGESRFVGGCVRDKLLHLDHFDIDIATRLRPEEVVDRLKKADIKSVPTGIEHGTVTAVLSSGPVEITTLRRDVSTDGRRATVAFTDDWEEDAARRDFTINALSADPETSAVFDYFGGLADLSDKRVRFIGDPLKRIAEDHLRILRFFRFHARFGREVADAEGLQACSERANDLMALSRERIADELLKLLGLADPAPTLALMIEHGILSPVFPEINADGGKRLAALVQLEDRLAIAPHPIRRLASLLPQDPETAASVSARLRLSNRMQKRLVAAAECPKNFQTPKVLAWERGTDEAIDCLLLMGDEQAAGLQMWERPRFGLTGGSLIELGLKPGPDVARTLQMAEREWAANGFTEDLEEQRKIAKRLVSETLQANS